MTLFPRPLEGPPCTQCGNTHPSHLGGRCFACRGTFDPFPGTDATMFIQWKGTEVCMDFTCACGFDMHIDAGFAYAVECPACHALYEMGSQVKARKMTDAEAAQWRSMGSCTVTDDGG